MNSSSLSYQRPAAPLEHEIEIKRSRFIALLAAVENEREARDFIDRAKTRFPDARHHCSAYLYHVEDSHPVQRFSDDGEPSGTAGKPILDVLKGSGMTDICVVVVRYFGGVKLGAGGLVHAYGGAASQAVDKVRRSTRAVRELYDVASEHAAAGRIEAELRGRGYEVVNTEYGEQVTHTFAIQPGGKPELVELLASLSQGQATPCYTGSRWIDIE